MDVRTWRQVAPGSAGTILLGAFVVCYSLAAVAMVVAVLPHARRDPVATIVAVLFVGCSWTFVWRLYRTGLYVSRTGLRLVWVWRTRTLPWSAVVDITSRSARAWGVDTVRDAIWVTTASGEQIETPIQRRTAWLSAGWRKNIGPVLPKDQYDQVIEVLRSCRTAVVD